MQGPVILFDGVCNLCCATARFVVHRDPDALFRFAALQSPAGQRLLSNLGQVLRPDSDPLESVMLLDGGKVFRRSTAALRICHRLNALWPILYVFIVIPAPIRDAVYNFVGNNRYRWFGKKASCWIPEKSMQDRFLQD